MYIYISKQGRNTSKSSIFSEKQRENKSSETKRDEKSEQKEIGQFE